jgi:hypothetical protein
MFLVKGSDNALLPCLKLFYLKHFYLPQKKHLKLFRYIRRSVGLKLRVENLSWATFDRHDIKLAAVISYLQQQLKQHPPVILPAFMRRVF